MTCLWRELAAACARTILRLPRRLMLKDGDV